MKKQKHVLFSFLHFTYKCRKQYFGVLFFQCLINAGLTLFNVYSLSLLIAYLETHSYFRFVNVGLLITAVNLIFNFLNKSLNYLIEVENKKMTTAVDAAIAKKLMTIPFSYLEDPYYLDLKERAQMAVKNMGSVYRIINDLNSIIQSLFTISGLIAIITSFDYRLTLVLGISVVLSLVLVISSIGVQLHFFNNLVPINRKYSYYLSTLMNTGNVKDFKMYSVGKMLDEKFKLYSRKTYKFFENLNFKTSIIVSLMEVLKYCEMAFVYVIVIVQTITNKLPISKFSLYISSAISFSQIISRMIEDSLDILQCVKFVGPLLELINIEDELDDGDIPFSDHIEKIEFRDVSFMYPKTSNYILKNISFTIHKGEKISIVGLNGAGKTTIVKLICRLYEVTEGNIYVNDIPINKYEYDSYIKHISTIFQDFKLFAYSLKENILNEDGKEEDAYSAICQVGLKEKIDSLPNGINSLYTKAYAEDGIELSGGEKQKVAIARAVHSSSDIVILDEPTAALDPLSEAEIYKNFNALVHNRTAIYISHRMSSSVFCDRILVIDNGVVADFDTHSNLMHNKESLYYKLFTSQANNYRDDYEN